MPRSVSLALPGLFRIPVHRLALVANPENSRIPQAALPVRHARLGPFHLKMPRSVSLALPGPFRPQMHHTAKYVQEVHFCLQTYQAVICVQWVLFQLKTQASNANCVRLALLPMKLVSLHVHYAPLVQYPLPYKVQNAAFVPRGFSAMILPSIANRVLTVLMHLIGQ